MTHGRKLEPFLTPCLVAFISDAVFCFFWIVDLTGASVITENKNAQKKGFSFESAVGILA